MLFSCVYACLRDGWVMDFGFFWSSRLEITTVWLLVLGADMREVGFPATK